MQSSLERNGSPFLLRSLFQKNPRAHKNKIGTSPPPQKPKKPKILPPLKRGILWTWLFLQNGRIFSRRPQNWRSHFRPQNRGQKFYGHEDFSEKLESDHMPPPPYPSNSPFEVTSGFSKVPHLGHPLSPPQAFLGSPRVRCCLAPPSACEIFRAIFRLTLSGSNY